LLFTTGPGNGKECRIDGTDGHYLFFVLLDLDVVYNPFPVALIFLQVDVSPSVLALLLLVAHYVYLTRVASVPLVCTLNVLQCHFPQVRQVHGNYSKRIKERNRMARRIEAASHLHQAPDLDLAKALRDANNKLLRTRIAGSL
jgi:hypothetical protein